MPSWKKRDYIELFPSKIDFSSMLEENTSGTLTKEFYDIFPNLSGSMLAKKICSNDNNEKVKLTPKELIMILLADRTKCFLDAGGYKMHFMQPYSLRSLDDLFYLFYNMENIYKMKKDMKSATEEERVHLENDYYTKTESNRKILLDYLNFKMLHEFEFDPEKIRFINSLLAAPIERRGRIVWDYYHSLLNHEENKKRIVSMYNEEFYEKETSRHIADDYSFGELFRCLFSATRLGVLDREFVQFVLASFSFTMPQFVELQKKEEKDNKDEWKRLEPTYNTYWYPRIREAFGYSLIGSWCKALFDNSNVSVEIPLSKDEIIDKINGFINPVEKDLWDTEFGIILQVFTLCSFSSQDCIEVEYKKKDNKFTKFIFYVRIDPTAFILNSLRLKDVLIHCVFN